VHSSYTLHVITGHFTMYTHNSGIAPHRMARKTSLQTAILKIHQRKYSYKRKYIQV